MLTESSANITQSGDTDGRNDFSNTLQCSLIYFHFTLTPVLPLQWYSEQIYLPFYHLGATQSRFISRSTASYDDPDYPVGEVLVNGVDFQGYTREEVKEAMGNAKVTLDSDTYLAFEADGCNYTFTFQDGSETLTAKIPYFPHTQSHMRHHLSLRKNSPMTYFQFFSNRCWNLIFG